MLIKFCQNFIQYQRVQESCFIYPSRKCLYPVEFLMRTLNLKRAEFHQKFGLMSIKKPGLEALYRTAYHTIKRKNPNTLESTW